jgi:hypothetical protein
MTYQYSFLLLLLALFTCQSARPETSLVGHWQFQQTDQTIYLSNGTVVEKIKQQPPQSSERSLDISATELIYHHVMDKSYPGDSAYTVSRSYTRQGNTLLVVPYPGIEAGPVLIHRLTSQQLILRSEIRIPGAPYTVVEQCFNR